MKTSKGTNNPLNPSYNWKNKYSHMESSYAMKLKVLEDENRLSSVLSLLFILSPAKEATHYLALPVSWNEAQ